jgi:hypothetical protein
MEMAKAGRVVRNQLEKTWTPDIWGLSFLQQLLLLEHKYHKK